MVDALESAVAAGHSAAADRDAGQMNFFESFAEAAPEKTAASVTLPSATPWSTHERLQHEKSVLGLYVSSHPLDAHRDALDRFASVAIADIDQLKADTPIVIGGMLTRVRPTFVRTGRSAGQKMAMISIEDRTGSMDGVIFSDSFAVASPLLTVDGIVFLKGRVDRRREEPSIVVDMVIPVERAAEHLTQTVKILLRDTDDGVRNGEINRLQELLRQMTARNGEAAAVIFEVKQNGTIATLRADGLRVAVTADLPQRIATVLHAEHCCELIGPDKVLAAGGNLYSESDSLEPKLTYTGADGETCDSIERY